MPDWLERLRANPAAIEDLSQEPSEPAPDLEDVSPLPEWLRLSSESDADQLQTALPDEQIPDWIKVEAEPAAVEPGTRESDIDAIPDWLKQTQTETGPSPEQPDSADAVQVEIPEWLKTRQPPESAIGESAPEPAQDVAVESQAAETASEQIEQAEVEQPAEPLLETLEAAESNLSSASEPELPADELAPEAELPEWLRGAASEPVAEEELPEQASPSEVPEWVLRFKPTGVEGQPSAEKESEPVESAGSLAGLRGVLPLAVAITEPHPPLQPAKPIATRGDGAQIFEAILAAPAEQAAPRSGGGRRALTMRPLIYLLFLLAVLVPFLLPFDLTGATFGIAGTPTAEFFDTLEQRVTAGSTVVLAFDYDPSQSGEMDLIAGAIVRDLMQRHVNIVAVSTFDTGMPLAQRILDAMASEVENYTYGTNYVILYLPGQEAGLAQLAANGLPNTSDFVEHSSLSQFPLTSKIKTLRDASMVIELAGAEEPLRMWMEQVQPRTSVPIAAAVSAAVEPKARAYRGADQLVALMAGLLGAAQYEVLSNQPGLAVISVNAQTAAQLVLVLVIVLGNVAFWISRARGAAA
ncbi:MAG: hypothetical protein M1482_01395 [Chloroflexi bacterium]|nr:hypothetical protein [Chloroflexota bacterium]